jgi:hypothetical protein
MDEREVQRLHAQYRLDLSERIETCLKQLASHFPGLRFETVVNERGWGGAVSREKVSTARTRRSYFSRLEMAVRPLSESHILELTAKATVRNRELFTRNHFQQLSELDLTSFHEVMDLWVLEFAQAFASEN